MQNSAATMRLLNIKICIWVNYKIFKWQWLSGSKNALVVITRVISRPELAKEANNEVEEQRALATLGRTHLCHSEAMRSQLKGKASQDPGVIEALNQAEDAFYRSLEVCERLVALSTYTVFPCFIFIKLRFRVFIQVRLAAATVF